MQIYQIFVFLFQEHWFQGLLLNLGMHQYQYHTGQLVQYYW